jgi:hypothetical protein
MDEERVRRLITETEPEAERLRKAKGHREPSMGPVKVCGGLVSFPTKGQYGGTREVLLDLQEVIGLSVVNSPSGQAGVSTRQLGFILANGQGEALVAPTDWAIRRVFIEWFAQRRGVGRDEALEMWEKLGGLAELARLENSTGEEGVPKGDTRECQER